MSKCRWLLLTRYMCFASERLYWTFHVLRLSDMNVLVAPPPDAVAFHDDRWRVQIDSTWCWIRVLGHDVGSQLLLWPDRARGVFCGACLFDLLRMQLLLIASSQRCSCNKSIKNQMNQIYAESLPGLISAIQVLTDIEKQPSGMNDDDHDDDDGDVLQSSNHHKMVISRFNKVTFTGHMKLTPKPRAFWLGGGGGCKSTHKCLKVKEYPHPQGW